MRPERPMVSMLEFTHVRKSYGSAPVLEIAGFQLANGLYWLKGPNGSGKTTLLKMVAGILTFEGEILLQGLNQRDQPVKYHQRVAWADAEPLYPGFLTGADLLAFYSSILRPEKRPTDELIDRLGIRSWLGTKAASWSSGMTRKISLLLAFLGRPALIVLDEPFSTLDEAGKTALYELIREYHQESATGFLLSSHQDIPLAGLQNLQLSNRSIHLAS